MRSNYLTTARAICVKGIRDHKTFPSNMKPEAIAIIQDSFQLLGQTLAAIELTHLREVQHKSKK